jgi:transposase InsO family protein
VCAAKRHIDQKALMPHRNAPLTETGRLRLARCIVDQDWPLRRAAERFQVSPTTAKRWADRYRSHGVAGLADRSSRPHHSPRRLPLRTEHRILGLRVRDRLGPARIAARLRLNPATVHRVLVRYRAPRLADLDRATGTPVRRYERARPGELVHVDVKKLGRVPDGGGHRVHGRVQGNRNRQATTPKRRHRKPVIGYTYLHTAIDDHSRLAYSEPLPDERQETAAGFWRRAHAWFAGCGVTVERVLTDNGAAYISLLWRRTVTDTGAVPKRTRPYRPQTNGKVERFNRTLLGEWAYARPYASEQERQAALPEWLHRYNHHRGHTALGGLPPASRVPNLTGQYT